MKLSDSGKYNSMLHNWITGNQINFWRTLKRLKPIAVLQLILYVQNETPEHAQQIINASNTMTI